MARVAGDATDQALVASRELVPHRGPAGPAVAAEQGLDAGERVGLDDGGVFAVVDLVLVADLADVRDVGQQAVQGRSVERLAAARFKSPGTYVARLAKSASVCSSSPPLQLLHDGQERLVLEVELEDRADPLGLGLVHHQLVPVDIDVVAEDRVAAGPLALAAGGGDLVQGPFREDLPLELGAGQPGTSVPGFGNRTSRPIEVAC
jgi:hypothetical protein